MRLFALGLLFYPPNHHYEKTKLKRRNQFPKISDENIYWTIATS